MSCSPILKNKKRPRTRFTYLSVQHWKYKSNPFNTQICPQGLCQKCIQLFKKKIITKLIYSTVQNSPLRCTILLISKGHKHFKACIRKHFLQCRGFPPMTAHRCLLCQRRNAGQGQGSQVHPPSSARPAHSGCPRTTSAHHQEALRMHAVNWLWSPCSAARDSLLLQSAS